MEMLVLILGLLLGGISCAGAGNTTPTTLPDLDKTESAAVLSQRSTTLGSKSHGSLTNYATTTNPPPADDTSTGPQRYSTAATDPPEVEVSVRSPEKPLSTPSTTDLDPAEDHTDLPLDNHTNEHHEGERYHVAVIDFSHVSVPFIVSLWIIFASLAKIGFHLNNRLSSIFPESCMLIILGVIVGVILYFSKVEGYVMKSETFFLYLLPPIILDAGYFMPNRAFFDNLGTILLFAVVGTIFNMTLIGVSLWGFSLAGAGVINLEINLLHCLVFASLISAVDPVAVLAVFEEVHVNDILNIIVFGESLLNDAVTVVLYHMFETYSEIGEENIIAMDILAGAASFLAVGIGGTVIGIIVGLLAAFFTRFTDHVPVIQPLVILIFGYLSYLTAEIFHLSGIMACTFCGITMKKYVEANISKKSHTTTKYFLKMLASICETIIFMFLGISTVVDTHDWDTAFILLTLAFCLIYRTIGVVLLSSFANCFRANKLSRTDQFIMAYGGLRGAIAFSLVVLLNSDIFPQKRLMITATVVVVYFTVFIQGVTIKPLVDILRVKRSDKHKHNMNEEIGLRLIDHMMAGIEDIAGHFGHNDLRERFQRIDNKYLKPVLIRPSARRMKGLSILSVYEKLNEKDAQDYLATHGSFVTQPSTTNSLYKLFQRSQSFDSNENNGTNGLSKPDHVPLPDSSSMTCLDMHVLDVADESNKMKDDQQVHHVLGAMFNPRKRFTRPRRHMLPDSKPNNEPFRHRARLHLRHLLTGHKNGHHHHHHHKHKGSRHGHHRHNGKDNDAYESDKQALVALNGHDRKNVSFADEINKHDTKEQENLQKLPEVGFGDGGKDSSDTSSDHGITFTAHKTKDDKQTEEKTPNSELSSDDESNNGSTALTIPTAVEASLPWKRQTGREGMSSVSLHSLPDEEHPPVGEAPSWVTNEEYTELPAPIPSPMLAGSANQDNIDSCEEYRTPNDKESAVAPDITQKQDEPIADKENTEEEKDSELPLPWKRQDTSDDDQQAKLIDLLDKVDKYSTECSLGESTHADHDTCLPPPWRTGSARDGPVRSPSATFEMDSLCPQPSNHSLRLSEAESRHSEPYPMHHHVIDLPPRPLMDNSELFSLPGQGLELDTGFSDNQMDPFERVESWLLSNKEGFQDPPPENTIEQEVLHFDFEHDVLDTYL